MTAYPLEEFETARWRKYQKEITELVKEFQEWSKAVTDKYLATMDKKEREENLHRITEDGRFLVSFNIEKLLGKE